MGQSSNSNILDISKELFDTDFFRLEGFDCRRQVDEASDDCSFSIHFFDRAVCLGGES